MTLQTSGSGAAATPNDVFRRIRGHYFRMLGVGLGLGLLALIAGTNQWAPPWLVGLMLLSGIVALIVGVTLLRSAVCPKCETPVMWRASPGLTASRVSLLLRPKCPSCGLDFDAPMPPDDKPAVTPNPEKSP